MSRGMLEIASPIQRKSAPTCVDRPNKRLAPVQFIVPGHCQRQKAAPFCFQCTEFNSSMDSSTSEPPFVLSIGDSHSKFWSGRNTRGAVTDTRLPQLRVLHLGPVTAHNIKEDQASTGGKVRLKRKLAAMRSLPAAFIVSMGEIDCRTHLIRAALLNKSRLQDAVDQTVERYVSFLEWITNHYQRPAVAWGPGPSSPPARIKFNPNFPVVGSAVERNYATFLFNERLRARVASKPELGFATQFDHLTDADGHTLPNALFDGVHVDSAHFPDAIKKVRVAFQALGRPDVAELLAPWTMSSKPLIVDIGESAMYRSRSSGVTADMLRRAPDFFPCRSDTEGIHVDLMAGYSIKMVELPSGGQWLVQGAEDPSALEDTRLPFFRDEERSIQRGSSVYVSEASRRFVRFLWLVPRDSRDLSRIGILVRSFHVGANR
jgi:hypothetical protein